MNMAAPLTNPVGTRGASVSRRSRAWLVVTLRRSAAPPAYHTPRGDSGPIGAVIWGPAAPHRGSDSIARTSSTTLRESTVVSLLSTQTYSAPAWTAQRKPTLAPPP